MRTLVAVITGGRASLAERPTRRLFAPLKAAGFIDIEWVVREDHAAMYERDDHPLNIYPQEFADNYARHHWRHPTIKWEPRGFSGAFPGREWAMRTAEDRGYDAVLQLDDNILHVGMFNAVRPYLRAVADPGSLVRLLTEFLSATNIFMMGMQLSSVPLRNAKRLIRTGFPYSIFVERCGQGRMPYYGPFEDDIMHAMEYGLNGGPMRTVGITDWITYLKESQSGTGMRQHYNAHRGLELPLRYPNNASISVGPKTSSPVDTARGVRHRLTPRGFTPIRVIDQGSFDQAETELRGYIDAAKQALQDANRAKMRKRGES